MKFSLHGIGKQQAILFVHEVLYELSAKELDAIFSKHIGEYHDADKRFLRVKEELTNPQRVS